jgi:hypothetical protein
LKQTPSKSLETMPQTFPAPALYERQVGESVKPGFGNERGAIILKHNAQN